MSCRAMVFAALAVGSGATGALAQSIDVVSYTYDAVNGELPSASYPDNQYSRDNLTATPTELDDDLHPNAATNPLYSDPNWVGINDPIATAPGNGRPQPLLTFDLGTPHVLDDVTIEYLVDTNSAVWAPDSVDITFSTNGTDFTPAPLTFTAFTGTPGVVSIEQSTIDLQDTTARYVRMSFLNDQEWTFLSEFDFEGTVVPEPTGMLTLGAGAFLALLRRRRGR